MDSTTETNSPQGPNQTLVIVAVAFVVAVNAVTFFIYGFDKKAARNGSWRVSERMLLTLSAIGGWPAALLAMRYYHHKTAKPSFQAWYCGTIVINVLLCCGIYYLYDHLNDSGDIPTTTVKSVFEQTTSS